jgi:hypothetical protein
MLQKHLCVQTRPFQIVLTVFVAFFLSLAPAQAQNPCEAALQSPEDILDLDPSSPVSVEQAVSEWNSEILKLRFTSPGLLTLGAEGSEADGSLQKLGASGLELVNGAPLESEEPLLTLVDAGEVYCLRVDPRPGAEDPIEVQMELVDLCALAPSPDDHGDSFACATAIELEDQPTGSISEGDRDVFTFSLETEETVEIQSDGGIDTSGRLYDETGALLDSDEDGGPGLGFRMSGTLPAGSYFVRVESSNSASGAYSLSLDQVP